jgi:hypothetical protein
VGQTQPLGVKPHRLPGDPAVDERYPLLFTEAERHVPEQ